jgi:ferredoxin
MKKVWIEPGCITCGACEFIAPEVFEVTDTSHIKPQADLKNNSNLIEAAAQACPVNVIKYTKS